MTTLRATGLVQQFGGVRALDGVDIAVTAGEVVGVIGPNGCGKTTLLDALTGVRRPERGDVELDARVVTGSGPASLARRGVARTFQAARLLEPLDVERNVMLGLHAVRVWRRGNRRSMALTAMQRVGIDGLAAVPVSQLSHGQRRCVELARALAAAPRVLVLDEPTAGLFATQARAVIAVIRATATAGCAVLLVEHDLGVVRAACDRVLVMEGGRVVDSGAVARVLAGRARATLAHEVSDDRLLEASA